MKERYLVSPLHDRRDIEIVVEAEDPESAHAAARPEMRRRGIPESDPLTVQRERPIVE